MVLFGISLQRDTIHLDFVPRETTKRHAASFRDGRLADGEWHSLMVVVTRNKVKFNVDCSYTLER